MNILGLIEMHPFDGTEPFICLRINNQGTLFDLPITQEQLNIVTANVVNNAPPTVEEDSVSDEPDHPYEPTNASFTPNTRDDDAIVLNANVYAMGAGSEWDEDDDL